MSESNPKKAAESRGAAAKSDTDKPVERQTPEGAQQQDAASSSSAADDERLNAAVEAAESAATRAEQAVAKIEELIEEADEKFVDAIKEAIGDVDLKIGGKSINQADLLAEKVKKAKEPEIGSDEWQHKNRLDALNEELGFAETKGQDDRVKAIKAEIKRLEKN